LSITYKRLNITLTPRTLPKLKEVAKKHGRSQSNTIDMLIQLEFERLFKKGPNSKEAEIRRMLDDLHPEPKKDKYGFTDPNDLL